MESEEAVIPRKTTTVPEEEWNDWMSFIWEEYIIKDCQLEKMVESLKQRNPQVTLAQLRTKLRHWGFQKSPSKENWRYVDHEIQKRKSHGKESAVVLSGIRFPQEKVKSLTERHKAVTLQNKWMPPSSPEPPSEEVPLYVCTPRAVSPAVISHYEWPKSLPWLRLNETALPQLMSGLRLLPGNPRRAITAETASQRVQSKRRHRSDISIVWSAFEKLVRRSMEIIIGSEELTHTLLLNKSIDRIAGHLDQVIPSTYMGENLRRATVLSGGPRSEAQKEILKILLFLASNHLIMDYNSSNLTPYINDARAFVDVCRFSGLTEPNMLARVVQISLSNPTLTSVVDLLYEAAVNTESFDLVSKLLTIDGRIDTKRCVGRHYFEFRDKRWTALEFSLVKGSLEHSRYLLKASGNINDCYESMYSPLELAISTKSEDMSVQLIRLLLENGMVIDESDIQHALLRATTEGRFQLISYLRELGADFTLTSTFWPLTRFDHILMPIKDYYFLRSLDYFHCLGVAACFTAEDLNWYMDSLDEYVDDQHTALRLVKYILELAGPEFDVDGKLKSDAMISAAMRGYTEVISFLCKNGARIDSKNGYLCPIYAAVDWHQVETCRLLFELGGSARADYRLISRRQGNGGSKKMLCLLSPIHVAVSYNSCELVGLLAQNGVDVDFLCEASASHPNIGEGFCVQAGREYMKNILENVTPLNLATIIGFWEVALLLVNMGATFSSDDLLRAATAGQHQLVSQLLELGANPCKDALRTSICNKHELVALELLASGAETSHETLGFALQHGLVHVATTLVNTGTRLSGSELAWAFRIPDEPSVRSLLQSQLSSISIGGRSPDGRSFL